jgi:hypothetical protein
VVSAPNDVVLHVLASTEVASRTRVKIRSGKGKSGPRRLSLRVCKHGCVFCPIARVDRGGELGKRRWLRVQAHFGSAASHRL